MFTSFVFQNRPREKAEEEKGKEEEKVRELDSDEGMLKTGRVVHSREATENGGASVLYPIPSLLLFRSNPHRLACPCVRMRVYCVSVCACVRLLVRPTYRRLFATLLRRAHRLAGTRRTCPHRRVVPDSTGCPDKNLPDENLATARKIRSRGEEDSLSLYVPVETVSSSKTTLLICSRLFNA